MLIFDCHCDTLDLLTADDSFYNDTSLNLSYPKLVSGGVGLVTFAVCSPKINEGYIDRANRMLLRYDQITSKGTLKRVLSKADVDDIANGHTMGALLALEGADILCGDVNAINKYFDMGARMLSLTWNNSNLFCGGIGEDIDGLSQSGKELVIRCKNKGIIIDVSHASRKGFWDIAELLDVPFVATHSNAFALCKNKRNLDDDQLRAIAKVDGIVGMNFYPPFLRDDGGASIDDVVRHIEYIASLIGTRHIAIGSDFDGVDNNLPKGLDGADKLQLIPNRLLELNYPEDDVKSICYGNYLRVLKRLLPDY